MNDDLKQRIMLFIAIFVTMLVVFELTGVGPEPPEPKDATEAQDGADRPAAAPAETALSADGAEGDGGNTAAPVETTSHQEDAPAVPTKIRDVLIRRPDFDAVFTTRSAALRRYRLNEFTFRPDPKEPAEDRVVLLDELAPGHLSLALESLDDTDIRDLNYALVEAPAGALDAETEAPLAGDAAGSGDRLVFRARTEGWEITRAYRFAADGAQPFRLEATVAFRNLRNEARNLRYVLAGPAGIVPDDDGRYGIVNGMSAALAGENTDEVDISRTALPSLESSKEAVVDGRANIAWVGLKNRFFTAILLMNDPAVPIESRLREMRVQPGYWNRYPAGERKVLERFFEAHYSRMDPPAPGFWSRLLGNARLPAGQTRITVNAEPVVVSRAFAVGAGARLEHGYVFYGGPADSNNLGFDPRLRDVVAYTWGFIQPLARLFTWVLDVLAGVTGNFGVAIILLTLMLRSLLHPLTRKALASGHKMQKIQPRLKEMQKRFENDRVRLQQETMKLWQEEGVTPWGGCLPMLCQIPIFFALYGTFANSFTGRHAVFIPGWINDLSQPDHLMVWDTPLPLLGWTAFNLLPIIYIGLSMFHMSMQPKSEDPQVAQQQRMMKFMPLMFALFIYEMPSGLVLYFTVSSSFVIVEHYLIKKKLKAEETDGQTPRAAMAGAGVSTASPAVSSAAGTGVQGGKRKKKKKKR